MIQRVFLAIHATLGISCLAWGVYLLSGRPGSKDGVGLLFILACCFLGSAAGLFTGKRLLAFMAAIPVICLALFYIFILLVGGWAWGPGNAQTVNIMILGGIAAVVFETFSIILTGRKQSQP
jgi:hypothetical protein